MTRRAATSGQRTAGSRQWMVGRAWLAGVLALVVGLGLLASAPLTAAQGTGREETRVATTRGLVYQVALDGAFVVWGTIFNPPPRQSPNLPPPETTAVLLAASLTTTPTQVITIAERLRPGAPFTLQAGLVAWSSPDPGSRFYTLRLFDLTTGRPAAAPSDPASPGPPAFSGPWLVWANPAGAGGPALVAWNRQSGERRTLAPSGLPGADIDVSVPLAADGARVAYVAAPAAGVPVELRVYDFADGSNTLLHTFGPGDSAPRRIAIQGPDVLTEQPTESFNTVTIVRWNARAGRTVLGRARAGTLAAGGGLAVWQPSGDGQPLAAFDLSTNAAREGPLIPPQAAPSGPSALDARRIAWADLRDVQTIYIAPLAAPLAPDAVFNARWAQADGPVAAGQAIRSWTWGPSAGGFAEREEPFAFNGRESHRVRYYDKGTMEINDPAGDPQDPWFVTSGLLVVQLVAGCIRVSPTACVAQPAPTWSVAGDPDSADAPTYATLGRLIASPAGGPATDRHGEPVTATLDSAGQIGTGGPPGADVRVGGYEPATMHNVAAVFADYLRRGGAQAGGAPVFDGLRVVGFPITEPYWIRIWAAGRPREVLMQAFERRVLTYSPGNPPGWQVEMGNVGRHYFDWRETAAPRAVLRLPIQTMDVGR